jgi:hypothetical protein
VSELFAADLAGRLWKRADACSAAYRSAEPFPHAVLDDFLPAGPLLRALGEFPVPGRLEWQEFDDPNERKLAFNRVDRLPDPLRELLHLLNSATMLEFLERLTGIQGLLADPYYIGGGLHQIERGGHFAVHADFNRYERFGLDRRLNLLLYLNPEWKEGYGGHLELWDRSMQRCVRRVLPVFDRCVVFSTTDFSFHGHPEPLRCPAGWTRRSVATYYCSNARPVEEASASHSTLFQARPGESERIGHRVVHAARAIARAVTPPIVRGALRALRRRISGTRR